MSQKCHGYLPSNFDLTGLPFNNELEFEEHYFTVPDVVGLAIGKRNVRTGKLYSLIKKDHENNSIDLLEKSIEQLPLIERVYNIRDDETGLLETWVFYYLSYDVKESSKNLPTILSGNIYGRVLNGHYKNKYELLLSNEDVSIRFTFDYTTINISMYSMIASIKDWVEEAMDGNCEIEEFNQLIKNQDGSCFISMYDEVGEIFDTEFGSVDEVLSFISSIRCVGSEFIKDK